MESGVLAGCEEEVGGAGDVMGWLFGFICRGHGDVRDAPFERRGGEQQYKLPKEIERQHGISQIASARLFAFPNKPVRSMGLFQSSRKKPIEFESSSSYR